MNEALRAAAKNVLQHWIYPGRFLWRLPRRDGTVALTFDDGPHPEWTPRLLDVLDSAGVRATFFLIGQAVERHPGLVRRMVESGHAVGGHGYDHTVITRQTPAGLVEDLARCRACIADASGTDSPLFRPPKGEVDWGSIRTACRAGYTLVHWSRTYSDYRQDGVAPLLSRMEHLGAAAGDILLLHDTNPHTVDAVGAMLPRWLDARLRFVTLPARAS
jgi:peptidoglycan-N-acetylglucosamine deacetylase